MSIGEAILLGVVQGLFMFVPVSSTSHLALVQHALLEQGSMLPPPDAPEMILFDIIVHVGTVVSIIVVMRGRLLRLLRGIRTELPAARRARNVVGLPHARLGLLGLLSVLVTGVLGLGVQAIGTEAFARPELIAAALVVTGIILWWTDVAGPLWRDAQQVTITVAVVIGVAQAAALLPGLSRSGLTIAMALAVGLHRHLAAEYSFFIAIPTIVAAAVVQALSIVTDPLLSLTLGLDAYLVGFAVAAVVGAAALVLVLRLLYQARFRFFAVYVWFLAAAVLLFPVPSG
jgi:undecaprenyl-diphosphatase